MHAAIIAVHDAAPAWEKEIVSIMESLRRRAPQARPALLAVPNFHSRGTLSEYPSFVERIRDWTASGCEPVLHGFYHFANDPIRPLPRPFRWVLSKTLTASEGEFLDLDAGEISRRLDAGRRILSEVSGAPVRGFVPPAWLRNEGLFPALRAQGFAFTEGHGFVYDLARNRRHAVPAVTFSGRSAVRAAASRGWAAAVSRLPLGSMNLRLAIHPGDWHDARLRRAIESLVETVGRTHRWGTYKELMSP